MVADVVLLAQLLDHGLDLVQVAVVDGGKQVVLDLEVEAASEEEHKEAVGGESVGGENLMLVVIYRNTISPRKLLSAEAVTGFVTSSGASIALMSIVRGLTMAADIDVGFSQVVDL